MLTATVCPLSSTFFFSLALTIWNTVLNAEADTVSYTSAAFAAYNSMS